LDVHPGLVKKRRKRRGNRRNVMMLEAGSVSCNVNRGCAFQCFNGIAKRKREQRGIKKSVV
jgi:hypothetical protein